MAINFTDFSKAPILDDPSANLFENVLKGYKMSQEPAKMKQEATAKDLANQLKNIELQHKPKQYELDDAGKGLANSLKQKALEHYEETYDLDKQLKQANIEKAKRVKSGDTTKFNAAVANADKIWSIEHPEGATTPELKKDYVDTLKKAFNTGLEHTQSGTERSKILNQTQFARAQTNEGKLLAEQKDVIDGFLPGTDRTQKFDKPGQQQFYKDNYDLKLQKERSDSVTRNRAIYAGLVDNTFDNINVDKLVQYGGIGGEIEKRLAQGQLVPEKDQAKYREYKQEVAKVQVLAKQIRQFYGDSISPGNLQKLEQISNPAKWSESPGAAKAQFEAFKKIVKQETGIYRSALKSISAFQDDQGTNDQSDSSFDFAQYPVAGGG